MITLTTLVSITCIGIALIAIGIVNYRTTKLNRLYINIVHDTSKRYKFLCDIRQQYIFSHIVDDTLYISVDTLSKFKNFNIDKYVENYIRNNKAYILQESMKVLSNRINLSKYNTAIANAPDLMTEQFCTANDIKYIRYNNLETIECLKAIIKPVTIKNIRFIIQYTSPAGRNHYEKVIVKDIMVLSELINIIERKDSYKQSEEYKKKHERQLLTPGLRYDIMKRDGFRCVICGRTAEDEVKLHVDHIKPISKGGLTVPDNLRTLCQECNLGKSDKYDEDTTDQNVNSDYYIEC